MPWHTAGNRKRDLLRGLEQERKSGPAKRTREARRNGRETRQEAKNGGGIGERWDIGSCRFGARVAGFVRRRRR